MFINECFIKKYLIETMATDLADRDIVIQASRKDRNANDHETSNADK